MTNNNESQLAQAVENLRTWSRALAALADDGAELWRSFETGDDPSFHRLVERAFGFPLDPPLTPDCFDFCRTITGVINLGTGHFEERCVWSLVPPELSNDDCRRLIEVLRQRCDATAVHQALKDIGLLHCRLQWIPDVKLISDERCLTLCPGPAGGPGPDPARVP